MLKLSCENFNKARLYLHSFGQYKPRMVQLLKRLSAGINLSLAAKSNWFPLYAEAARLPYFLLPLLKDCFRIRRQPPYLLQIGGHVFFIRLQIGKSKVSAYFTG